MRKVKIEESEIMQELHKNGGVGAKKIAEETGLIYRRTGEIIGHGGYIPRGVMKGGIKEALIRWRWIDDDIDEIQKEMRVLESRFNDPAIASYIERTGGKAEGRAGIDELLAQRETLEGQYADELSFLLGLRSTIHKFVNMLDEVDRQAVKLRFLHGKTWKEIAMIMGRSEEKTCWRVQRVIEHYDKTGEYLVTKRYRLPVHRS